MLLLGSVFFFESVISVDTRHGVTGGPTGAAGTDTLEYSFIV